MERILFPSIIIVALVTFFLMDQGYGYEVKTTRHHEDIKHNKILNFWEQHKNEFVQRDTPKEVVLVMGNTGAGKSTLVLALMGKKLRAIKSNGYLRIVDDEDKIGTGTSSKTLVPEIMVDDQRNVTYVDCSGFRDNRDAEYEISSLYFQNILMSQVEKIKLVLVVNYESLKVNGNKNDFDDLLEHVGEFLKNITKFHSGIALVATKVENTFEMTKDGLYTVSQNDQPIFDGIADFLEKKKEAYRSKTENPEQHQMFADLIDALLQKNGDGVFRRINFIRNILHEGELEMMPQWKKRIEAIASTITDNLQYVTKENDDFGFALSKSSKYTVNQIVNDIVTNSLSNRLDKIGNETLTHYLQLEKESSDIALVRKRISEAYGLISNLININKPETLFEEFLNVTNTLNIPVSITNLKIITDNIKALRFFTTVLNENESTHMLILKTIIQNIIRSMENLKSVYDFLDNFQQNLASYNSQALKFDTRIKHILTSCAGTTHKNVKDVPELESIAKEIGSDVEYQKIKSLKFNQLELQRLQEIFIAFTSELEFSCESSTEPMTVRGYNIRIKDVSKIDCWEQAKSIQLFALNKIFFDESIHKSGLEAQLFVFAPTWEVIGAQTIYLNGKPGESHNLPNAKSAFSHNEDGGNGLPGLPGGSGGKFFGVGGHFIYLDYLEIHANGGIGGPAQNGGNGIDGISGEEFPDNFSDYGNFEAYCIEHNLTYTKKQVQYASPHAIGSGYSVTIIGKPAKKPTNGGNGGVGGIGGHPGKIMIIGLGKSINVKISSSSGPMGLNGTGGSGGKGCSDGRSVYFRLNHSVFGFSIEDYVKFRHVEYPSGKNGMVGGNTKNLKQPVLKTTSLYPAINAFKDFARRNLFRNIKQSQLRSFIHSLENDKQIKMQYNTLAFVNEFQGLESQYSELKNITNFAPFYDSLLNRIEEFAKTENIPENRKVLSYIYTAALTKALVLKKKRKGQTIVDLSKYLDSVEQNIKDIRGYKHLETVQKYRDDYKNSLNKKIREANDFIENIIEPEIDALWNESEGQIQAIVDEIIERRNETKKALSKLLKEKEDIQKIMGLRAVMLPFKLASTVLSFAGPIGAGIGVGVTTIATVTEGALLDRTSGRGEYRIQTLDPNLKVVSRITEVFNNKYQLVTEKLNGAMTKLAEYEQETAISDRAKKRKLITLKTQLQEVMQRRTNDMTGLLQKLKDEENIRQEMATFTKSEKDVLEKKAEAEKSVQSLEKEKKYEKSLRILNDVQSLLNAGEIIYSFTRKFQNDEGILRKTNELISTSLNDLEASQKLEDEVYSKILPDIRQIEQTINDAKSSINGSSHAKLDLTKWNVRTTLKDVKSLLQKFTQKMTFELQSNLQRFIEKIDEGFSMLIDIYDRIDSYADSVKQAEYIAHIESASMDNNPLNDIELNRAVNDLKLIIHSNLLTEKYETVLHAFKQHYFPFAADVLRKYQLPNGMQLNDTETLRSEIIEKLRDMKNHIVESESMLGAYSKYIYKRNVFDSNTIGSSPFYVWKHDAIKKELQQLLNGSEIVIRADISKGLFYNAIKYNDIGLNFKFYNESVQRSFARVLANFKLTMTMIGNNYYRCGERYYSISFDDDIAISYTLHKNEEKNWINPNEIYTLIHDSHAFLSPYGMWKIKLESVNRSVPFEHLKAYANELIDLELVGRGYCIEQNADFNFEVCNQYLDTLYDVENIVKVLF